MVKFQCKLYWNVEKVGRSLQTTRICSNFAFLKMGGYGRPIPKIAYLSSPHTSSSPATRSTKYGVSPSRTHKMSVGNQSQAIIPTIMLSLTSLVIYLCQVHPKVFFHIVRNCSYNSNRTR